MTQQVKSYKKFVATAATATLVASAIVPVASAATSFTDVSANYKEAVDYLVSKDITQGLTATKFGTQENLKRQDAAVWLAKALELDMDKAPESGFTDVPERARKAVNALKHAGYVNGKTDTSFGAEDPLKRGEMALILAKAYDLKGDGTTLKFTDVSTRYNDAVKAMVANGITSGKTATSFGTDDNIKRGEMAIFVFKAEKPTVVVAPEVVSVSATNLKVATVEFNTAIDEETLTTDTVDVADQTYTLQLSEDKKTLSVVFNSKLAQSEELEITVDGVKSVDGKEVPKFEKTVTAVDTTIPTVDKIVVLNGKQIEVYASEPIDLSNSAYQVLNNIKVDGVPVIAKVTPNYTKNSFVLEFASVQEPGNYKLSLADLADYAGYKAVAKEFNFTVVEDKAAPKVTSAEVKNIGEVIVTFDEAVDELGTFKVNGVTATATQVAGSNGTKYSLTGFGNLDLSAIVEVTVAYKGQKDVVGNEVKDETKFTFKVADDTALPTVSHKLEKGNKLTLTFSKSMLTNAGTITVLDKDGDKVSEVPVSSGLFVANTNNTQLELSGAQLGLANVNPDDYTVVVEKMKDATVRANLLPKTELKIKALDTMKPVVSAEYLVTEGTASKDDTVTFYFSEKMDTDSLNNLSNYLLDGVALSTVSGVKVKSIAADGKSVTITYPNARTLSEATTLNSDDFTVFALKDVAGNVLNTTSGITRIPVANTAVSIAGVEATKGNEIVVTFNTDIASVDPSFLSVKKSGVAYAVPTRATVSSTNPKEVTFILNKEIDADTNAFEVVANNFGLVKNVFGQKMTAAFADQPIDDKIQPSVSKAEAVPFGIKLTFTEDIDGTVANLESDIILKDKNGVRVSIAGKVTETAPGVVTIAGIAAADDYTVQIIPSALTDADTNANLVKAYASSTIDVGAGSIFATPSSTPDNKFTVTNDYGATPVIGDVDMDSATAGVQNAVTVNGLTYTATMAAGGVVTVAVTGTATATAPATTQLITVNDADVTGEATDTVTLNIPAVTAGDLAASVNVTIR